MPDVIRTAIGPSPHMPARRTVEEALFVRWPRLYAVLSRRVLGLSPRSRLRRTLLRRSALSGWAAWLRSDFELMAVRFTPDSEYEPPREWTAVGMRTAYRGQAGLREWAADMREAWEWTENTPLEIVDAGNPIVFINRIRLRAHGSGLEFDFRAGLVLWMDRRGLVARERDFLTADEAFEAAGIDPAE
jgi:hypothetical protein